MSATSMLGQIDPNEVEATLLACLYTEEEVGGLAESEVPEGCVEVDGVLRKFGLHPERLEARREQVREWLSLLPRPFHKDGGGGWSFLNACAQEGGHQWTGEHRRVDFLFVLGAGLGMVTCLLPREMWGALPGGMPYYVVDVSEAK